MKQIDLGIHFLYQEGVNSYRQRVYQGLHIEGRWKLLGIFILLLILLNLSVSILESDAEWGLGYRHLLAQFEMLSLGIFGFEYLLRLWSCVENDRYRRPILGRIKWALSPMGIIDLMVFLPFVLSIYFPADLRPLRAFRLIRIFLILKMGNFASSVSEMIEVITNKKEELIVMLSIGLILLLVSASVVFYFENPAQPAVFSSIPKSLWWAVETLTTLGYGDMIPVTPWGRFFASLVAMSGIALFALPAGVMASGFSELVRSRKKSKGILEKTGANRCPHCDREIDSSR